MFLKPSLNPHNSGLYFLYIFILWYNLWKLWTVCTACFCFIAKIKHHSTSLGVTSVKQGTKRFVSFIVKMLKFLQTIRNTKTRTSTSKSKGAFTDSLTENKIKIESQSLSKVYKEPKKIIFLQKCSRRTDKGLKTSKKANGWLTGRFCYIIVEYMHLKQIVILIWWNICIYIFWTNINLTWNLWNDHKSHLFDINYTIHTSGDSWQQPRTRPFSRS